MCRAAMLSLFTQLPLFKQHLWNHDISFLCSCAMNTNVPPPLANLCVRLLIGPMFCASFVLDFPAVVEEA